MGGQALGAGAHRHDPQTARLASTQHLWLQHLPKDQVPDCGPGLGYMLDAFPISKTLKMVFTGSGECAEINWTLLGLSMPGWTLISYVLLSLGALWAGFRRQWRY